MKIAFLEPPPIGDRTPERIFGCSYELFHFPDLANLYLAAYLAEAGHDVLCLDAVLNKWSPKHFLDEVHAAKADVHVIHSMILSKEADISFVKDLLGTGAQLWFHGPEPTRVPEQYLLDKNITVLRGEPERHARELLEGLMPLGVSLLGDKGFLHKGPDPALIEYDDLPHPARWMPGIVEHREHFYNPKFRNQPFTTMMASRGCSFRCRFCVPNSISFAREMEYRKHYGKKPPVKAASSDYMATEFKSLEKLGYQSALIVDDQFLWKKQRTLDFCDAVKDVDITWGCLSRADFLTDPEVVSALSRSGCASIDIGVESLDERVLNAIGKDLNPATVKTAVDNLNRFGIEPKVNIIFGTCDLETPKMAMDTVDKLKNMDLDNVMFSIATPFKGTEFYQQCKSEGLLVDTSDHLDPMRKSMLSYPGFSKEQLQRANRKAYRRFYLRPKFILRRLRSLKSPGDFLRDLGIAWKIFR